MTTEPRNARLEAQQRLQPGDGAARVLEPSPPAVNEEPHWADDPVDRSAPTGHGSDIGLVLPAGLVDADRDAASVIDWDRWSARQPDAAAHEAWLAARWLGGPRRLPDPPPIATLVETRTALHRLAAYVVAPVRHRANGKFGLRWTLGGFGTPFFGDDRQVRVEGTVLVDQRGDSVRRAPIGSLREAADFLDGEVDPETAAEHDSPEVGDLDEPLTVDEAAVAFLGNWFGMAYAALEAVRADPASIDPSRPQLWPGHFDPAIEVGSETTRASYGASPGDHGSDAPYLYVSLWSPDELDIDPDDPFWNADGFVGRVLDLDDLLGSASGGDPAAAATRFWRETRDRLR